MNLLNSKILKIFISLIFIGFAYHYFLLGTTSISKLIETSNNQKIKKIDKFNDKNKLILLDKENVNNKKDLKLTQNEKENDVINNKKNPSIIINETNTLIFNEEKTKKELFPSVDKLQVEKINVKKNETFDFILSKQKIDKKTKQNIINTTKKVFNLRKLKIGQEISFHYKSNNNQTVDLEKITIPLNFKEDIIIDKVNNDFIAKIISLPISKEMNFKDIKIENSLFESGNKENVPNAILIDLIRLYSFDVDFQRDIRINDKFKVYYEIFYNDQRREVAYGDIIYANLSIQGKQNEYFLFENSNGFDYFNKEGKNVRKALMKTPVDGARLSSSFGLRKHPILGYDLMHRGVDFAAPKGTPVFAAGNGTIEYAGVNGAYGKYIRIRHNNSYKTAYAHLNGFKKGMGKGKRVNQGEIIAYIGTSGRSTGPHLHYEVMFNGNKINPMKMKLPSGKSLKGVDLEKFAVYTSKVYSEISNKIN